MSTESIQNSIRAAMNQHRAQAAPTIAQLLNSVTAKATEAAALVEAMNVDDPEPEPQPEPEPEPEPEPDLEAIAEKVLTIDALLAGKQLSRTRDRFIARKNSANKLGTDELDDGPYLQWCRQAYPLGANAVTAWLTKADAAAKTAAANDPAGIGHLMPLVKNAIAWVPHQSLPNVWIIWYALPQTTRGGVHPRTLIEMPDGTTPDTFDRAWTLANPTFAFKSAVLRKFNALPEPDREGTLAHVCAIVTSQ